MRQYGCATVSVKQAPQNHVEDPNQFNQDEDEAHDVIFDFFDTRGLAHPATPVEPPTPTFFEFEFASLICGRHASLSSSLSNQLRLQDYIVSVSFILKKT